MKKARISFDTFLNSIKDKAGRLSFIGPDISAGFEAEKFPCSRRDGKIYIFDDQYICQNGSIPSTCNSALWLLQRQNKGVAICRQKKRKSPLHSF